MELELVGFKGNVVEVEVMTTKDIASFYGMSTNEFNKVLSGIGVHHKKDGRWELYSNYKKEGYVLNGSKIYEGYIEVPVQWTKKGMDFLYNTLKEIDLLPL